jgi:predicted RNase H-like HicB family nuclease
MRYPVNLRWSENDKAWIAEVYDLPGCLADGKTQAAALKAAAEVADLWLETARKLKREIPEPSTDDASGQLLLRMPKTLHRCVRRAAEREGISLNQYLIYLLSERNALHSVAG